MDVPESPALTILNKLGLSVDEVKAALESKLSNPSVDFIADKVPQKTPRFKKTIEFAMEETRNAQLNWVGTAHLLLGIIRDKDSLAGEILHHIFAHKNVGSDFMTIARQKYYELAPLQSDANMIELDHLASQMEQAFDCSSLAESEIKFIINAFGSPENCDKLTSHLNSMSEEPRSSDNAYTLARLLIEQYHMTQNADKESQQGFALSRLIMAICNYNGNPINIESI